MTKLTCFGGVSQIGGNKFLIESNGTRILMDFGMNFAEEGKFFDEYMGPRTCNSLADMVELGMLPKIEGLYRRDYAKHMGFGGNEDTSVDAVLLTHAHIDHCGYVNFLRPEIPVYCSDASHAILQSFDDTGTDQYLTFKENFQVYENRNGEMSRARSDKTARPRNVIPVSGGDSFSIDSIEVLPIPIDHSIPGMFGYILHTPDATIANTGDLRLHGRRPDETEGFIEQCSKSSLDLLMCEGTRINKDPSYTELDVEQMSSEIISKTENLVVCSYPIRDLDRFMSIYNATKASNRVLAIDTKQAYLLKLFNDNPALHGMYPSPDDSSLRIFIHRGSWGLLDKDLDHFTQRQLLMDYKEWEKPFLDYHNAIDYRDVRKQQRETVLYCSDFKLQQLIDIKPDAGASYIRSSTEPFDIEMRLKSELIKNWLEHFGLISNDRSWHQIHVSGHGDREQIAKVVAGSNAKKVFPIHTEHPEMFQGISENAVTITENKTYEVSK